MKNYYTKKELEYLKDFEYSNTEDLIEQIIECVSQDLEDAGYEPNETRKYLSFIDKLINKLRSKVYPLPQNK